MNDEVASLMNNFYCTSLNVLEQQKYFCAFENLLLKHIVYLRLRLNASIDFCK